MTLHLALNFLDMKPSTGNKRKNKLIKKLMCIKGHYQKSEKATHSTGQNISKS